ncbi:hypothetical protein AGMMS49928_23310 [Spirochaetia bacterium]|nr:hypothetical protein AGMMS49928_23310 [Spirochaetia bacterium]
MKQGQLVATWISFMNTAIRKTYGLSIGQYIRLAQKYHLISFLADNYELLHYYGTISVVDDVTCYIAEQGGTIDEFSKDLP